jgi:hypothetical protein
MKENFKFCTHAKTEGTDYHQIGFTKEAEVSPKFRRNTLMKI